MKREELLKHHTEVCARALEIMQVKNHDYAGKNGEEPFANFERCEAMGVCSTETGFLVRVIDKVSRLSTFVDAGELKVKGETWKDAVLDIMNYMILFSAFVSDKEKEDLPMGTEEFLIEELEVTPNTVMHHPV